MMECAHISLEHDRGNPVAVKTAVKLLSTSKIGGMKSASSLSSGGWRCIRGWSILLGMPKGRLGEYCSPVFTDALHRPVYRVHRSSCFALFRGNPSALLSTLGSASSCMQDELIRELLFFAGRFGAGRSPKTLC